MCAIISAEFVDNYYNTITHKQLLSQGIPYGRGHYTIISDNAVYRAIIIQLLYNLIAMACVIDTITIKLIHTNYWYTSMGAQSLHNS